MKEDAEILKSRQTYIKFIFVIIFLVIFFLLRWNSFSAPFERDEGEYAYSAWLFRQGIMPYQNSFLQKPPMIIYTYAFGQLFDAVGIISPRILAAIFSLITISLTAVIARKELGTKAGWISAFLLTPMLVLPYNAAFSANTEHFMLTPLMAVLVIFFYKRGVEKPIHFFWAGVLGSVSILYKPFPVYLLTFLFIVWFRLFFQKEKNLFKLFQAVLALVLGGGLTTLIVLLPFIIKGGIGFLIESVVVYNRYYIQFIGYGPQAFIVHNLKMFRVYWPFLILIAYYLYKRPKNWWFYIALLGIAIISIYQSWINHYYIFIMPFVALIAAYSIVLLGRGKTIGKTFNFHFEEISTTAILFLIILPFSEQFSKTPQEMSLYVYGYTDPFYEAPLVAQKLASVTKPEDKVFIAGSEPEILFYAKRKSATRFVITYPLNITTRVRETYQNEVVKSLVETPPKAIVYSTREHSGLWNEGSPRTFIDYLKNILQKNYKIAGAYVWRRTEGFWLNNPQKSELENASYILYVRK